MSRRTRATPAGAPAATATSKVAPEQRSDGPADDGVGAALGVGGGSKDAHARHHAAVREDEPSGASTVDASQAVGSARDDGGVDGGSQQLGGLDVTGATGEQLAAFAARFSAALVGSLPSPPSQLDGGLNEQAAFGMAFPPSTTSDQGDSYSMLPPPNASQDQDGNVHGAEGLAHSGGESSSLRPPSPPPSSSMTGLGPGEQHDGVNGESSAAERESASPKKKRRASKMEGGGGTDDQHAPKRKRERKPRREKYSNVTAQIEDDTKTLEGIGRIWAANTDKKKHVPLTELFTRLWLEQKYIYVLDTELSRKDLLESYQRDCEAHGIPSLNDSALGRAVRAVFPQVGTRRLGKRGHSTYYYTGIYPKDMPLPERASERAAPSTGANKQRRDGSKRDEDDGRHLRASEASRGIAAPPAAYATNPPPPVPVAKSLGMPYTVSSTRSGGSSSRNAEPWYGPAPSTSKQGYSASARSLRSGVAASAASSNMRTHIAGDEMDGDDHAMRSLAPPPPPPMALQAGERFGDEDPASHSFAEGIPEHSRRASSSTRSEDEMTFEPSDMAASALFMLNQGGVIPTTDAHREAQAGPSSHPAHDSPSTPSTPSTRVPGRRTHTGIVAQRGTSSIRAGPQDRPQFPTTESIFAPRARDPNAPPRKPRKPSKKKKKGVGAGVGAQAQAQAKAQAQAGASSGPSGGEVNGGSQDADGDGGAQFGSATFESRGPSGQAARANSQDGANGSHPFEPTGHADTQGAVSSNADNSQPQPQQGASRTRQRTAADNTSTDPSRAHAHADKDSDTDAANAALIRKSAELTAAVLSARAATEAQRVLDLDSAGTGAGGQGEGEGEGEVLDPALRGEGGGA